MNKIFITKLLFFQILCGLVASNAGLFVGLYTEVAQYEDTLYKYITVANVDVSNKTPLEAISLVESSYLDDFLTQSFCIILGDQTFEAPLKDFFKGSNLEAVITEAFEYSKSLSLTEKYKLLAGISPMSFDISLYLNTEAIADFVANFIHSTKSLPHDASILVTQNQLAPENIEFSITPHIDGIYTDKAALCKAIEIALQTGSSYIVDAAPFTTIKKPQILTDTLASIDTLITSYTTTFNPATGSGTNLTVGSKTLNGTLVMPGELFSFNEVIGDTTAEKGYVPAPVISNNQYIQGLGGGICQVSSTLYNAVLQMGLNSVSRRPHSKPSSYVPLGLDATISWDSIDYKFENTFDYPIYIESYTHDNQLRVNLYSHHTLSGVQYKLKSELYQIIEPPIEYKPDPSLPAGSTKLADPGKEGYKVKVIREAYEGDTLKATEVVSIDTYRPSPTIYNRGH